MKVNDADSILERLYDVYLRHPIVTTDSRKATMGSIFFALRGERFDGHSFVEEVLKNGAAGAVIDNPDYHINDACILVRNSLQMLQRLATHHRRQFDIPVIAITGSNGKTTTKELVSSVLGSHYKTHCTQGNLNNHIGVPLTLLSMPAGTEVAVIEMGANHQGEIDELCRIAEPTHGLITNIGKAHLEGFGGLEGVKKGKSELYRYLGETGGVVFINQDEPYLTDLASTNSKKIFYHRSEEPDPELHPYETKLIENQPFLKVGFLGDDGKIAEVHSQLYGAYNFQNIATAITLGRYFKVPAPKIARAIEAYVPANNRSQVLHKGSRTYILDAYNANPTSMTKALENFSERPGHPKIAILGAMLELGEASEAEHQSIAKLASSLELGQVVLVGAAFEQSAKQLGLPFFLDVRALKNWFETQQFDGAQILIKGSRGIQLELLLNES